MHDELWAGVDTKLEQALDNFVRLQETVQRYANSVGPVIEVRWRQEVSNHTSDFLSAARSVPDIIRSCFGHDMHHTMAAWFSSLPPDERQRRDAFGSAFQAEYKAFNDLPLSKVRIEVDHRQSRIAFVVHTAFAAYAERCPRMREQ